MRDVAIGSLLPTRTGTAILRGLHKRAHCNGHQPVTCRTQSIKDAMVGKEGGKDSGLCRIQHKPDHVGLWIMSDRSSK